MPTLSRAHLIRQRVISLLAIALISFGGFEALLYINNLNEPAVFLKLSWFIYLIYFFWTHFLFDLHFKGSVVDVQSIYGALRQRFHYFRSWQHLRFFQNYLVLPGIIYWGTVTIIGINFGHVKLQQFVAIASGLAMVATFAMFKEIFHNKQTPINNPHFVILSYVKLYAAWLIYSAALGIVWYYGFPALFFYSVIGLVTVMLLYQALFQCGQATLKNVFMVLLLSAAVTACSIWVYIIWNVNYFSAGLFMAAIYNLLWGILYHAIHKNLNREVVFEQLAIFLLIVIMVSGVTNFNARILR